MGFEIQRFQGDVDEELICPICSGVLEDPLQAPECEHAFCRACIREWISRQPTCPVDRQAVTASQLRPVSRLMRNLLSRLCTSCDNAPHGCNAVLPLDSLASHLVECEFNPKRPMPCEAGCGLVIPKDELAEHNCVRELRALIATHQGKLNNYEQELAELKRTHQEKLNDYEQELAEHKRELALLKEFMRETRLSNPSSMRTLADLVKREEVVRWAKKLPRVKVPGSNPWNRYPSNDEQMCIKRSLSGCPPDIIDDLMKNSNPFKWPPGVASSPTTVIEKYVYRKLSCFQAVVVLHCDNTHMDENMILEPGFVVLFRLGIQ